MTSPERVLIMDDDRGMCELVRECLAPLGCEVTLATNGKDALEQMASGQVSVAVLDMMLPDMDGMEVLKRIRDEWPQVAIIVLTAYASVENAIEALRMGACDYVTKPFHADVIRSTVQRAVETQRFRRRLTALNRATQAMIATLDPDRVLDLAMGEAREMLGAEATAVYLLDKGTDELRLAAAAGAESGLSAGATAPSGEGIAGSVSSSGEPALVEDVGKDKRFSQQTDALVGKTTRSLVAVPLSHKHSAIGTIMAVNKTGGDFDNHDVELLDTLAGSAAIAITNARLYQAERELRSLLEQSRLQLVQSDKLAATGRLAASLAHEINNPLQAIHNSLQLMLDFPLEIKEQTEYLEIADEEIQRLMGMVTNILEFARPPRREMEPTDINSIVERVITLAAKYLQHRDVTVRRDLSEDLPSIVAAPDELEQVVINLVLNAVDAMPEGGSFSVSTGLGDDGRVVLTFADTGHGIEEAHLERIFEPFFSTREKGSGLGLAISRNVVERHGGEIYVESEVNQGATFKVCLPVKAEPEIPAGRS
jgi:signal transduction histidine kinase